MDSALREHFGFPAFRPGQREGCEAALADRDLLVVMPTGSGKSLCYQLPALMRDDLTLVVSPLVSLMQDQVEALARARARGAGGARQLAAGRGRERRGDRPRAAAGELRLLYVAPERFASPGFLEPHAPVRVGPVRGGRGALRVAVGARLPARLLPAGRRRARRRRRARSWRPRPRPRRRSRPTSCAGSGCAIRCAWPPASTGRTCRSAVARPAAHEKRALMAALLREPDALPAIVYAGTRAGAEEQAEFLSRELGVAALPYHAGLERGRRAEVQRALPGRRGAADRGHERVRHGRRQAERAHGAARVHAGVARGVLPGGRARRAATAGRRGRCCWPRGATRRCTCTSSSATRCRRTWPRALAERVVVGGRRATAASRRTRARCAGARRVRRHAARAGGPPRAGGRDRGAAVAARPGARHRAAVGRQGGGAPAHGDRGRGAGALAPVPRDLGVRGGRDVPAPGHPAPLRRPRRARSPRCPAATSAIRRWRSCAAARRPGGARGHRRRDHLGGAACAKPSVGRNLCAEILHGAKTKKIDRNSYDGLPAYGLGSDMRRADIVQRIDELVSEGGCASRAGPTRCSSCRAA